MKIVREDFIFAIGYSGETAIVDLSARKKYAKLDTAALAEMGLFKPAFCSAMYSGNSEEFDIVLKKYNKASGSNYAGVENLKRLYGVFGLPENVDKVKYL